jgi:hypothetical protein
MNPAPFSRWRTSSYSTGNPNNCVEVGEAPSLRAVRDSKLGQVSPVLVFPIDSWAAFTNRATGGWGDLRG